MSDPQAPQQPEIPAADQPAPAQTGDPQAKQPGDQVADGDAPDGAPEEQG